MTDRYRSSTQLSHDLDVSLNQFIQFLTTEDLTLSVTDASGNTSTVNSLSQLVAAASVQLAAVEQNATAAAASALQASAAVNNLPKIIYQTTAEGLAVAPANTYFGVANTVTNETDYYLNSAGVAVLSYSSGTEASINSAIATALATNTLTTVSVNNIAAGGSSMSLYEPDGTVIPFVTGSDGGIYFGIDLATGSTVGSIVDDLNSQLLPQANVAPLSLYEADDLVPMFVDLLDNVTLGWMQSTKKFVGSLIDQITANTPSATAGVRAAWKLLAADIVPVTANWNGIPMYGQSLSVGAHGNPAISLTQPYFNQTFGGGVKSAVGTLTNTAKPLIEDNFDEGGTTSTGERGETMCSGMANSLVEFAAKENAIPPDGMVVFTSAPGQGGQPLSALVKGTVYYTRLMGHIQAAKTLADAAGETYVVSIVHMAQGETDNDDGTTQAAWYALATQWVSDLNTDIPAITGQPSPVHVVTYQTPYKAASISSVQLAQKQWVDTNQLVHWSTPIYHLPYYSDGTHLINIGYQRAGKAVGRACKQLLIDKRVPDALTPISAYSYGTTLSVSMDVPTSPLVLDTSTLALTENFGFRVVDDEGTVAVTGITIVNGTVVQMTLARALSTNPFIRYGLDYLGTGLGILGGGSGNLRDSTIDTCTVEGTVYPMWHVAFAFQQPIIVLGS
jgi:hypothetical protein